MNFGPVRHLHFAGIGGAGMCGLAELLHREGLEISGCDIQASEATARLQQLGISITIGHDPSHLTGTDVLVISSALSASAKARASGKRAKRVGVTWFTRSSVHCADKMVATSSCSGPSKSNSQRASGYSACSRRRISGMRAAAGDCAVSAAGLGAGSEFGTEFGSDMGLTF